MSLKIEELHQMLQETSTLEGELESLCTHSPNIFISSQYSAKLTCDYFRPVRLRSASGETAQPTTSASQPIAAIHQKADTGAKMFAQSVQGMDCPQDIPSMSRDLDALSEDVRSCVAYSLKRLNQKHLDDVFNKNKGGIDECMPATSLRPALRELFPDQAVRNMDPILDKFDKDGKIKKSQWEFLATRPAPLEEWAYSLPLGSLLANALSPLFWDLGSASTTSAQKQRLTQCSDADLTTVCAGFVDGLASLLMQAIYDIRVQSSSGTQNSMEKASNVDDSSEDLKFDAFTDDEEVIKVFFDKLRDSEGEISYENVKQALEFYQDDREMVVLLEKMQSNAPLSLDKLKMLVKETPRLSGQRIVWAASLNLETAFAKYLHCGSLFDGLKGIKEMRITELRTSCLEFSSLLPKIVEREWQRITQIETEDNRGKTGFQALMNKFVDEGGFLGTFGDAKMFHAGLESQLGYPNPKLFRAILREHCFSVDSDDCIITGNYGLAFTPKQEFAMLFGTARACEPLKLPTIEFLIKLANQNEGSGPTGKELNEAFDELKRLQKVYLSVVQKRKNGVFSGEHGDEHEESILDITVDANNEDDAREICQTMSGLVVSLNGRYCQYLGGSTGRPNPDIRDAEAIARGIKVIDPAKVDKSKVSARISIAISQNKRDEFKVREAFEQVLKEKNLSCVAQIDVKKVQDITYHFVDRLNEYGPNLSEGMLSKKLNDLPVEELVVQLPNLKKGRNATDTEKKELIQQIIALRKGMIHCKQARRRLSLQQILDLPEVKTAKLRVEEAMVVYQYTGPLFQKWNGLLRQIPSISGNKYTTTIHVLVSAVLKLSQITKVPQGRRVYRGLGGMVLDDKWFVQDKRNTRGGVELGFLSTTLNRSTALEYSGVKRGRGIILEIDVGAIDCGAQLDSLSQYPGEGELLFSPLSFLEVVGMPRFQIFEGKQVVVVQVKININLKGQRIEEMISKRQQMHLASFGLLEDSVKYEIQKIADEDNIFNDRLKEDKFRKDFTVDRFIENIVCQVRKRREHHEKISSTDYLDNDIFRGLVIDMLDTAAMAHSKMRLYLTDKSLHIHDVAKMSLGAAQRMLIAYFTKKLPDTGSGSGQLKEAADALCRLKGLKNASNEETGDQVDHQRALIAAVAGGLSFEDLKLLRDAGLDLNKQDEDGSTAIYVAAQCGNARCIRSLVDLKANVNAKDIEDRTALFAAANNGDISCIKLLVELRADVGVLDKQKTSPLMVAASAGHFDCVLELGLIDGGSGDNLEQLKPEMLSALVEAINNGQVKVVEFIVKFLARDKIVDQAEFSNFCVPLLKRIDWKGIFIKILRYFGIDTNDDERLENMVYNLTDKFVLDILELKKFLGKLLFRFCDVDKNDTVTDEEIIECLKLVIAVAAASSSPDDMSSLAKAIFRIFDLNGNGSLELGEVVSIVKDLLAELHSAAIGILTHFEPAFTTYKAQLNDIVSDWIEDLSKYFQIKLPFPVQDAVTKLCASLANENLDRFIAQSFVSISGLEELPYELRESFEQASAELKEIGHIALQQYKMFFSQIVERAHSDVIVVAECVQVYMSCLDPIFGEFEKRKAFSQCLFQSSTYLIQSLLDAMPSENPMKYIVVENTLVREILDAFAISLGLHIKHFGFRLYFQAVCQIFSSEEEDISLEQVKAIQQVIEFFFTKYSQDDDGEQSDPEGLRNALSTLVSSIDKNKDSTLETNEIVDFANRIFLFTLSCIVTTVHLMEKVLTATSSPIIAFLFDVKSQVIGGNRGMLLYSDISAVALAVGMANGEPQALEFALDMIGDSDGDVDQNSLEAVCFPLFKLLLGSPTARNYTTRMLWSMGFTKREFAVKFHNSLINTVKAICPITAQTIFKLLDLDRNGFVSKSEAKEILEIANGLDLDSSPAKQFVDVAHAIFRVLDLDGDGKIAASELTKTISEIVDACVEMMIGILEEVQEILMDEPLEQIVQQLIDMFQREEEDNSAKICIETILNLVSNIINGRNLVGIFQKPTIPNFSIDENDKGQEVTGNEILELCYNQHKEFISKIEESAVDGECRKENLVNLGAVCLNRIVDSVFQSADHFEERTMDLIMALVKFTLASIPEEFPANLINIDRRMLQNALSEAVGTLHMHLKESASKNYFEALLNIFDLQKSGRIKSSNLQAVACIVDAAFMTLDENDKIRKGKEVEEAIAILIRMADIDGDDKLSKDEMIGFAKTSARMLCDLVKNTIILLNHALFAAITPVILIALNLKSQMFGGEDTALTHADTCSAIFVISLISGDTEVFKYLKGLLVYKEGDVDEEVFANLCSNLVQMALFWVPAARQYSKAILSEFAGFVEWEPNQEAFGIFHRQLMYETAFISRFMGQALYRFFDIDQSGTVTAQEVKETLDLVQAVWAGTNNDPVKIVNAIFRIFYLERSSDEMEGGGKIKLQEIQRLVQEVVELISQLAYQVLLHLKDTIAKDPLNEAIKLLLEPIQDSGIPGLFRVTDIAEIFSSKMSSRALCEFLEFVFNLWDEMSSNFSLENILAIWSENVQAFFKSVSEAAVDGKLSISQLENFGNDCFKKGLLCMGDNNMKMKWEALLMEQLCARVQELSYHQRGEEIFTEKKIEGGSVKVKIEIKARKQSSRKKVKRLDLPLSYFQNIIYAAANALQDQLMAKSIAKIVTGLSKLFDPKGSYDVRNSHFATLHDLFVAAYEFREDEEILRKKFEDLQKLFLSFSANSVLSSESVPVLDFEDTLSCASSVLQLVFVIAEEVIAITNTVALKTAPPILELILAVKARILESDENELTYEDVKNFKSLFWVP